MEYKAMCVYMAVVLLFTATMSRLYYLSSGQWLAQASAQQSTMVLPVADSRGMIYDREMRPLVSIGTKTLAAVQPSQQSMAALLKAGQKNQSLVFDKQALHPFTLEVEEPIYARGIEHFEVKERYGAYGMAPHIVGYLSPDGKSGAAGVELAYDNVLQQYSGSLQLRYAKNGSGGTFPEIPPEIVQDNYQSEGGIVLTLDKYVQLTAEAALADVEKGAAIVMNVHTGEILASASQPTFDPADLAASLQDENAPFVNRVFAPYSVGSTFKLVTAAAALEKGFGRYTPFTCTGYTEIEDVRFYCHWRTGHGEMDMRRAIEVSCNPYFIQLAMQTGGERIKALARSMGFDRSYAFTPELRTQAGNLPTQEELKNPAALGNLGFGQGSLTASPLQVAQMICTIANGGYTVAPKLLRGVTDNGRSIGEYAPAFAQNRVLSESTSEILQDYLVSNVTDGSGQLAQPRIGGAGGKTASAQTGILEDPTDLDSEIVHAWFAGFYPAENPQYAIVTLVENGKSGSDVAGPLFAQIADALSRA